MIADNDPDQFDRTVAEAKDLLRRRIAAIEESKATQSERLSAARAAADEARGWSLIEEPWEDQISAIPAYNAEGERTGDAIALPTILAKELWGSRLAFDMIDCGDDFDRIDEVQNRYFTMTGGDTGQMFLLAMSALSTISSVVVPQMLDALENQASDYDTRVMLAEARQKAWDGRVSALRGGPSGGDQQ